MTGVEIIIYIMLPEDGRRKRQRSATNVVKTAGGTEQDPAMRLAECSEGLLG